MDHHQILHSFAAEAEKSDQSGVLIVDNRVVLWNDRDRTSLPCPTCRSSPLTAVDKISHLTGGAGGRYEAEFGAEVPESWALLFTCPWTHGNCDPVVVVGEARLALDPFPDPDEPLGSMAISLKARFIQPALSLLGPVGKHVDPRLVELGIAAGSVVWIDPDAASNKLRAACELLLDLLQVPSTRPNGRFISLNDRIDNADSQDLLEPNVRELLDGLRWLGNAGSHGASAVKASDAIEGGCVLALALRLQFPDPEDDTVRAKALAWIQAKGV